MDNENPLAGLPANAQSGTGQCCHLKAKGSRCKANVRIGSRYCFFHDPESAADRHAAQVNGGKERSRSVAVLPRETPDRPLATAADVIGLLAQTINQVRRGEIDPHVSNAVGYLAGILLKAADKNELEQRLARLEAVLDGQRANAAPESDIEFVNPTARS